MSHRVILAVVAFSASALAACDDSVDLQLDAGLIDSGETDTAPDVAEPDVDAVADVADATDAPDVADADDAGADADAADTADVGDTADTADGALDVPEDTEPDAIPGTCGNLALDNGEACDGDLLAGTTCGDLGFASGVLRCADDCTRDTTGCAEAPGPMCNDGVREGDELCDIEDVGETTCADLGFFGSGVGCASDCTLSAGDCRVAAECGDGFRDGDEACDDRNRASDDGCDEDCAIEDCYAAIRLTWYADNDGDGVGSGDSIEGCEPPVEGAVNTTGDCDDDDERRAPGNAEICDGVDNDCNDVVDDNPRRVGEACSTGLPGECVDGTAVCEDAKLICVSLVAESPETCDDLDNDCDGFVDEGDNNLPLALVCYDGEADTRGVGLCADGVQTCTSGIWSACTGDVLPGVEYCDELDNDCDGVADNDVVSETFWLDADGDGQGDALAETVVACAPPEGYVDNDLDCDDTADAVFVGADELCNSVDDDCDEQTDEDAVDVGTDCATGQLGACSEGLVACDGGERLCLSLTTIATETCNGADDDCDGETDEISAGVALFRACYDGPADTEGVGECAAGVSTCVDSVYGGCVGQTVPGIEQCNDADDDCDGDVDDDVAYVDWFADGDGDGIGAGSPTNDCVAPDASYVRTSNDCNDGDPSIYPGATEVLNGRDDDCDTKIDDGTDGFDDDHDGYCEVGPCVGGLPAGDCDDAEPLRSPGEVEVLDGLDNDCDGIVDNRTPQLDDDLDGYCEVGPCVTGALGAGDCNDDEPTIYPGAPELDNGIDDNCNGVPDDRKTWIGGDAAGPRNWSVAANWLPVGVPVATDEVYIPQRANQPQLTANSVSLNLTLGVGAELDLAGFNLTVGGDVDAGDTIVGAGNLVMTGSAALLKGTVSNLDLRGTIALAGDTHITGNVVIADTGTLRIAGHSLLVDGAFTQTMRVGGGLRLNEVDDDVVIGGTATFGMGASPTVDAQGAMTAGMLTLRGNFVQTDSGTPTTKFAFAPSGTTVVFDGSAAQSVSFESPGAGLSHLGDVIVDNAAGVTLPGAVYFRTVTVGATGLLTGADAYFFGELPAFSAGYQPVNTHVAGTIVSQAVHATYRIPNLFVDAGGALAIGPDGMDLAGTLTVNGTLNVDGNQLVVRGVLTHSAGTVMLGAGTLDAYGPMTIAGARTVFDVDGGTLNTFSTLTVTWNATGPQGLYLDDADDIVNTYGTVTFTNVAFQSSASAAALTDGELRVHGDFVQTRATNGADSSFQSAGTLVIFGGTVQQAARFDNPGIAASRFSDLLISNPAGVVFSTNFVVTGEMVVGAGTVSGPHGYFTTKLPEAIATGTYSVANTHVAGTLTTNDTSIDTPNLIVDDGNTLTFGVDSVIAGPTTVYGIVKQDGHTVEFASTLEIDDARYELDGGELYANANVRVDGAVSGLFIEGGYAELASFTQSMQSSNPYGLVMVDAADDVTVFGSLTAAEENFYAGTTAAALAAGTLRLRGSLTQTAATGSNGRAFVATGTLVRFEGTGAQTVSLASSSAANSRLHNLHVVNSAGVSFANNVWITGALTMEATAVVGGNDVTVTTLLPRVFAGYLVTRTHVGADLTPDLASLAVPSLVVDATRTLTLGADFALTGDLVINGAVDIAGFDLDVVGATTVANGSLALDGGTLDVTGVVSLNGASGALFVDGGTATFGAYSQFIQASNARGLVMNRATDSVTVLGNFTSDEENFYSGSTATAFTDGTLRVRGNLNHYGGTGANGLGLVFSGTDVILDGTSLQTVSFDASSATLSHFDDIHIANTAGVNFASNIWIVGELTMGVGAVLTGGDLTVTTLLPRAITGYGVSRTHIGVADFVPDVASITLPRLVVDAARSMRLGADFALTGPLTINGSVDVAGHALDVSSDIYVNGGSLDVAGGSVVVGNDVSIDAEGGTIVVNSGELEVGADFYQYILLSNAGLVMVDTADVVRVGASFTTQLANLQDSSTEGRYAAGTLYVGGNFNNYDGIGNTGHTFISTGTRLVFDGTTTLDIGQSDAGKSRFADVEVAAGATLTLSNTTAYSSGDWTVAGTLTVPLNRNLTLAGTLDILAGGTLNLSGTIVTPACTVDPGATRTGSGAGCP